jgi:arabinogalactan oligomer / maltooligosaccharide transport system permease protein
MSSVDQPLEVPRPRAAERRRPPSRHIMRGNWWRHLVALAAVAFALLPLAYVVSAAFNADQTLRGASLIPREVTLQNFRDMFNPPPKPGGAERDVRYWTWYLNSYVISSVAAVLNVMLGALAAYAFSRFRFRGRRFGMMALLLIQMFPAFLALVAIYLILLTAGDVFSTLGLNSRPALILVFLGGAMGVNAWLMKGFFDTIPSELDESARVDGATPAQVFWGVILPLAAPVLAVVGIITFVFLMNEFIITSALMQTKDNFTLPVGLRQYINEQYAEQWGPFAAGALLAAIPVAILVMLFQRFFVRGLTSGAVKG